MDDDGKASRRQQLGYFFPILREPPVTITAPSMVTAVSFVIYMVVIYYAQFDVQFLRSFQLDFLMGTHSKESHRIQSEGVFVKLSLLDADQKISSILLINTNAPSGNG